MSSARGQRLPARIAVDGADGREEEIVSRLIVTEFLTLDGVMEAPGGEPTHPHSGWAMDFAGPEQMQYKLDEVLEAESLLIGRVTYESFAGAWPTRDGVFADKMNAMPKHVVSTTLHDPEWNNTTVISADVVGEVGRLKEQDGGPILIAGSHTLVHTLMEHDLVDEYRLMVFPVLVGGGLRLFPEKFAKTVLQLAGAQTFSSGVTVLTYEPARSVEKPAAEKPAA
jgi:dihydrofolate reductase